MALDVARRRFLAKGEPPAMAVAPAAAWLLSVGVAASGDLHHHHDEFGSFDFVDDAVVPKADPVETLVPALEGLAADGVRIVGKGK